MNNKKSFSLFAIGLMLFLLFVSCASSEKPESEPVHEHVFERKLSEGGLYYLDICTECGFWEVYIDEGLASRCAPFFGLDENIRLIESPESIEDYENNILYYALIGDYTPTLHFNTRKEMNAFAKEMFEKNYFYSLHEDGCWMDRFYSLIGTYADLLSYAMNLEHGYTTKKTADGFELTITVVNKDMIHYPDGIPSERIFFRQQLVALEQSKALHDEMHIFGTINDSMTDFQKLEAYVRKLSSNLAKFRDRDMSQYGLLKHDSLFGLLNKMDSNCVGTSANFAVLMRLEGMKAQMYSVEGHMIDRILADGKIVLYDSYSDAKYYYSDEEYEVVKGYGGINYGLGTRLLF